MTSLPPSSSHSGQDDDAESRLTRAAFAPLADAVNTLNAPDRVQANVLKAFDRHHRPSGAISRMTEWFAPGAAIAVSLTFSMWLWLAPSASLTSVTSVNPLQTTRGSGALDQSFIALQPLDQIALEPNPRVIETQVPKLMLTGLGVSIPPEAANETLRAEVLVSASGQALALRFATE